MTGRSTPQKLAPATVMDWILVLAVITFLLVLGFLAWSKLSTKRHIETGGNTSGPGGPNDPLSGTTPGIRDAEAIRSNLDATTGIDTKPKV